MKYIYGLYALVHDSVSNIWLIILPP